MNAWYPSLQRMVYFLPSAPVPVTGLLSPEVHSHMYVDFSCIPWGSQLHTHTFLYISCTQPAKSCISLCSKIASFWGLHLRGICSYPWHCWKQQNRAWKRFELVTLRSFTVFPWVVLFGAKSSTWYLRGPSNSGYLSMHHIHTCAKGIDYREWGFQFEAADTRQYVIPSYWWAALFWQDKHLPWPTGKVSWVVTPHIRFLPAQTPRVLPYTRITSHSCPSSN